ncbi:MAG: hypothetical protein ABFR62_14235, partial [Bacteroidota bacterium]
MTKSKITKLIFTITILSQVCSAQSVVIDVDNDLESPQKYAVEELNAALTNRGFKVDGGNDYTISIVSIGNKTELFNKPESFKIENSNNVISLFASDVVGSMYGIYELAEEIKYSEKTGVSILESIKDKYSEPALEIRADNPFLTIDENKTGISNWFYDVEYWERYFEKLARNRYNICDIHAMYVYETTGFPNIFPFFLINPKYPEASWQDEDQQHNLDMLKRIVGIAKDHGVNVSLMNYATEFPNTNMGKEAELAEKTSWAVAKLLNEIPDLWMFGFRIGESGKSEKFFEHSYLDGIEKSGKENVRLYTRTWLAEFRDMIKIGMKYPDNFYIEIKYNGEHLGAPYHAMQGRWHSYSYEKYLNYPRYWKIIWQIRPNGTHRVFPWNDIEFVKRTVESCKFGGAVGFTLEPITAYYPQNPDLTYKNAEKYKFMSYTTDRYWSWY